MNTPTQHPTDAEFAAMPDAELQADLERRILKHHEPRHDYAKRMGHGTQDRLHDMLKLALTCSLIVTVHAFNAANDDGPNAPATAQRIAA